MAQKDLDNAMKKIQGIAPEEDEEIKDLKPVKCDCGKINPASRDYCKKCGELISKERKLLKERKKEEIKDQILKEELDLSEEDLNVLIKNKMNQKDKIKGKS